MQICYDLFKVDKLTKNDTNLVFVIVKKCKIRW